MIVYDLFMEYDKNLARKAFAALQKEREGGEVGYYFLPDESVVLSDVACEIGYDTVVVIGIGGSSLGSKAIYSALHHKLNKKMLFLENPDPLELREKFASIEPEQSLFFVVSKSGTTIETISIFKALLQHFDLGLPNERIKIITDADSPLHHFADRYDLQCFTIPKNVGGRFSVLSAVGIVPLTLAGVDTKRLLDGARAFLYSFFSGNEEHLLYKASFFAKEQKRYPINVLFSYGTYLEDLTKWYVQLWGESLGKKDAKGERVGLTPVGHIGSVDQHSFLQLIIDGPQDKTVTFLKVKDFGNDLLIPPLRFDHLQKTDFVNGRTFTELLNAECDATKEAVMMQGVPADTIEMEKLDEESLGELIIYYELLTAAVGALLGINTYNQPGVELGKQILRKKFGGEE